MFSVLPFGLSSGPYVCTKLLKPLIKKWRDEGWLCPLVYLTVRVVNHFKTCNAAGTLSVPLWRSAYFWPRICPDGAHFSNFVHDRYILPHISNLFVRGKAKNCIFGNGHLNFIMLALRIDCYVSPRVGVTGFCTEFNRLCTVCT